MARESFNIVPYIAEGGGAMVSRSTDPANAPEVHKIGESAYQIVCDFLRDVIGGMEHGQIETRETDRAWSDGVAAVIAALEDADAGGGIVHQAWYQGMTMQGRDVPTNRRAYHTLEARDRDLDRHIARVVLQQAALAAEENVRAARSLGDGADAPKSGTQIVREFLGEKVTPPPSDPPVRMMEYLHRQILTQDLDGPFTNNLTPAEWRQLVKDARRERDNAEARHAKSEELRRADNAAWAADRSEFNDRRNQLLAQIDGQAREIDKLEKTIASQEDQIGRKNEALAERDHLRKSLDAEIVKLNSRLQATRDVVNAEIAKAEIAKSDSLPFDRNNIPGRGFWQMMEETPRIDGAFMGVAAIGAELASVRMICNNRVQRESDPVGLGKRLATIAGYALQLYREDRNGDPTVANGARSS